MLTGAVWTTYRHQEGDTQRCAFLVPRVGIEPTRLAAPDFESGASTVPPPRQGSSARMQCSHSNNCAMRLADLALVGRALVLLVAPGQADARRERAELPLVPLPCSPTSVFSTRHRHASQRT